MASLNSTNYYLDDWERIKTSQDAHIKTHEDRIKMILEWMKKEPHLPSLTKSSVATMMHIGHYSTEMTKELIDSYLTHKTRHPEMYTNRLKNMKMVEQTLDLIEVAIPDPWVISLKGERVAFVRMVDTDPSKVFFHEAMQIFMCTVDYELARVATMALGVAVVFDMAGVHIGLLSRVNIMDLAVVMKYIQILEQCVTQVHIINCNNVIHSIMAMVKPFLSRSLAGKLHFFTANQMDDFHKHIPKSHTPSTYGGELGSMAELNKKFRKCFRGSEDFIRETDSPKYYTKENQRRGNNGREVMTGSFRKLCID